MKLFGKETWDNTTSDVLNQMKHFSFLKSDKSDFFFIDDVDVA